MMDAPIAIVDNFEECKTSAERYLAYLKTGEDFPSYPAPEVVIICFQKSLLKKVLGDRKHEQGKSFLSECYILENQKVGILGGFGCGAPALAIKVEELIAWGVKKFISIGTAGALCEEFSIGDILIGTKALCGEDGVSHHYAAKDSLFAYADPELEGRWVEFCKQENQSQRAATAWSYSSIFKEKNKDILRVRDLGCHVVEMEAATLYAICEQKGVQALALFVISDILYGETWEPRFKEPVVKENLHKLANLVIQFFENL